MKPILFTLLISVSFLAEVVRADEPSLVDIKGFTLLLSDTQKHRNSRLIEIDRFLELSREAGTIILDTRSKDAFKKKHLKGAVHLNFSDFTDEKLAKVIPDKTTRILIYCNNNVRGDRLNFADKKVALALNIPTFINLVGYGYRNVYELASYLDVDDPRWEFEGTTMVKHRVLPRAK